MLTGFIFFVVTLLFIIFSVIKSYQKPSSFSANAYVEDNDFELYENSDIYIREYRIKVKND